MNFVDAARECLGTKFHHQGRNKDFGLDCIGLLVYSASRIGYPIQDFTNYSNQPDGKMLLEELRKQLDEVEISDIKVGDIAVFIFDKHPQHVGIVTDVGLIHTYQYIGKVVEHRFSPSWQARLSNVFRLRL